MHKFKKWIAAALVLLVFCGLAFSTQTTDNTQNKKITMIVKTIDSTNFFWTFLTQGATTAAKEYGIELEIVGTGAETEYEKQGKLIEEAIASEPDAIVLIPCDYTKTISYAKKIEDAGIPLVIGDSVMEEPMGSCVVATDNIEIGRKMGRYIKENIQGELCIGVVGHVKGVSTATEREQGLREGLGELEKEIVDVVFCDSDYRKAYKVTKEMLAQHPEINVIAGLNEYSSVGAARAVEDLKLSGKIKMVGVDSSIKEVQYLENGTFNAIVVQKPFNMGYLCIEKTVNLLKGETLPASVDSGSALITKETMYTEENQKLLFPI